MRVLVGIIFLSLFSFNLQSKEYFPKEIKHFRLVWHEDPATEATLAWNTKREIYKENYCYMSKTPKKGNLKAYELVQRAPYNRYLSTTNKADIGLRYFYHACVFKNLSPSTKYYFVVRSGSHVSKELHFITAPKDPKKSFKLIFGGDSRDNLPNIRRPRRPGINKLMAKMVQEDPSILALVHGGDYVFFGMIFRDFRQWFRDHLLTITKDGRFLPVVPTRGNHEKNVELFNDLFIMHRKSLKNSYYITKINNLYIFNLNTSIAMGGLQKIWLETHLRKYAKKGNWIFPNYHEPAWPAVKKPSDALKHFVPLFDKYQADLVFESDGHSLKKTVPIYKNKKDLKKGIIYLGEGGLGVGQRKPKNKNSWFLKKPGFAMAADHFFLASMKKDSAEITVISPQCKYELITRWNCLKTKVIDKFKLKHRAR